MHAFLTKRVDIAPLALFRIAFGALLAYQSFYYIADGWVRRNLIDPDFTFAHIGLEWLQPLPGNWMYIWFAVMGISALGVMAGFFYRTSLSIFTILWTLVYWMQKTTYNNHHYLIILLCAIMLLLPAARSWSWDSRKQNARSASMPNWCRWIVVAQVAIVYFFAGIAKLYPDWLDGTFSGIGLSKYGEHYGIGMFSQRWFHLAVAWGGLVFDLCIVPLMLWKRTRGWALIAFVSFHAFNSLTLDIGIFPFLAIALAVFFFPPDEVRKFFFRDKPIIADKSSPEKRDVLIVYYLLIPFLILQIILPLRHWLIAGDVLWTEEGHRLSWRMMLRDRKGSVKFTVVDKKSGDTIRYDVAQKLTKPQLKALSTHPDMIWQMAQRIDADMKAQHREVAVFVDAKVSINQHPERELIDAKTDLTQVEWKHFGHCDWIRTYDNPDRK